MGIQYLSFIRIRMQNSMSPSPVMIMNLYIENTCNPVDSPFNFHFHWHCCGEDDNRPLKAGKVKLYWSGLGDDGMGWGLGCVGRLPAPPRTTTSPDTATLDNNTASAASPPVTVSSVIPSCLSVNLEVSTPLFSGGVRCHNALATI